MSRKRATAEERGIASKDAGGRWRPSHPAAFKRSNEYENANYNPLSIPRFPFFLRFCEVEAAIYFAFSFFVAMRGIETTAKHTNQSTRSPWKNKRNWRLGNRQSGPQQTAPPKTNGGHHIRDARHLKESRAELKGREGRLRSSDYFSSQGLFADAERAAMRPQTMFSALLPPEMP